MSDEMKEITPKEARYVDRCPHCDGSLESYMRTQRATHINRCVKSKTGVSKGPQEFQMSDTWVDPIPDKLEYEFFSGSGSKAIDAEDKVKKQFPSAVAFKREVVEKMDVPEEVLMAGGKVASSKIPPYHLIPTVGLKRLAERFALGVERKGDKAWNAISNNQEILMDKEFLIERLGHIMDHVIKLRDKLLSGGEFEVGDDDAGAIAWAGMYTICATEAIVKQQG